MEEQKNNPLHGKTLEMIVTHLVNYYGWEELGQRINIKCFTVNPNVKSSLAFLRKTPWARQKTESLYLIVLHKFQYGTEAFRLVIVLFLLIRKIRTELRVLENDLFKTQFFCHFTKPDNIKQIIYLLRWRSEPVTQHIGILIYFFFCLQVR